MYVPSFSSHFLLLPYPKFNFLLYLFTFFLNHLCKHCFHSSVDKVMLQLFFLSPSFFFLPVQDKCRKTCTVAELSLTFEGKMSVWHDFFHHLIQLCTPRVRKIRNLEVLQPLASINGNRVVMRAGESGDEEPTNLFPPSPCFPRYGLYSCWNLEYLPQLSGKAILH